MLIKNKKMFNLGLLLGVSFLVVLFLIFSPLFPGGRNGLEYSDDLFNKLSKGSSYFIPKITENAQKFGGSNFTATIKMDKPEQVEKTLKVLLAGGMQVGATGTDLKIGGDLGKMLSAILKDSDDMYNNEGAKVAGRYGMDEKDVMSAWWTVLNKINKEFQKEKKISESGIVTEVQKKAVEPAYNFYHIEAQSVVDKAGVMIGLLVFYVVYTMWWGYSIFYMFDGLGLSMKKAKVKKEV